MSTSNAAVQRFWDDNPVDVRFNENAEGTPAFFEAQRAYRYGLEPHIAEAADFESMKDQQVLEIGCGAGTDAVEIAKAGARYIGVDVTPRAVGLTKGHLAYRGLPGQVELADATRLRFAEGSFDIVYSHGVLHHIPDIDTAVAEVHRVLKPGGRAVVMLYHRRSLNYYVDILFVRRLLALMLWIPGMAALAARMTGESETVQGHRVNLRRYGIGYLRSRRFLNHNTDGPENPLSRVYSPSEARHLFRAFSHVETYAHFLNLRWMMKLPLLRRLPMRTREALGRRFGWHLWIYAQK
jgi:SAM-dependent methyltransferase